MQEQIYSEISIKIISGKLSNLKSIKRKLLSIYPSDEELLFSYINEMKLNGKNKTLISYLLLKTEKYLKNTSIDETENNINIEHILPDNPDNSWNHINIKDRDKYTYFIGNILPLELSLNVKVGNKSFKLKRNTYKKSELSIAKHIVENHKSWTVKDIISNQEWMAKQAAAIWRIN